MNTTSIGDGWLCNEVLTVMVRCYCINIYKVKNLARLTKLIGLRPRKYNLQQNPRSEKPLGF